MKKRMPVLTISILTMYCCLVVVSCAGNGGGKDWQHPESIDDYLSFAATSVGIVQVAMNEGGDAVLAWDQRDSTLNTNYNRIYMAWRDSRTGDWTWPADETQYISPDGTNAYNASVAIDDDGNAIVAWSQPDTAGSPWIFASVRDGAAETWTHPVDLNDTVGPCSNSAWPDVAMADGGRTIAAWQLGATASTTHVQVSEMSAPGGAWSDPGSFSVEVPLTGNQYVGGPYVGLGEDGEAVLAWSQNDLNSNGYIFYADREAMSDTWNVPVAASDSIAIGNTVMDIRLDVAPNGNAVISWFEGVYSTSRVQVAWRDGGTGDWTVPMSPSAKLSPDGSSARFQRGAVNSRGDAVVVWRQFDSVGDDQIFMSVRNGDTGIWDNPVDLDDNISPDGTSAMERDVDMAENGHTLVVWHQYLDPGYGIFMSERKSSSGLWKHPADRGDRINPDGGESTRSPYAAVGGDGSAIVVWRALYNGQDRLYMSEKK